MKCKEVVTWARPSLHIEFNEIFKSVYLTIKCNYLFLDETDVQNTENSDNQFILELDNCVAPVAQPSLTVFVEIDIILHPSYLVPCPYISLRDQSGNPVSLESFNVLYQNEYGCACFDTSMYILDENPIRGNPSYTLHVCGIQEYMQLLQNQNDFNMKGGHANNDDVLAGNDHVEDALYFLKWFSLVGPKFNMPIRPEFFKEASKELSRIDS